MKLHLPVGLRAAVLAAFSFAGVTVAYADPATYYKENKTMHLYGSQTVTNQENLEETTDFDFSVKDVYPDRLQDVGNTAANPTTPGDFEDVKANKNDWVMDITGIGVTKTEDGLLTQNNNDGCSVLITNSLFEWIEVPIKGEEDDNNGWWGNEDDDDDDDGLDYEVDHYEYILKLDGNSAGPAVIIDKKGAICVMPGLSSSDTSKSYTKVVIGYIKDWNKGANPANFTVRLKWEGKKLILGGVWEIDPVTGEKIEDGSIVSVDEGTVIGHVSAIPNDYFYAQTAGVPNEELGLLQHGGLASSTGEDSKVTVSLYTENKTGEWHITGKADLAKSYAGRTIGQDDCVAFVGDTGVLYHSADQGNERRYDNETYAMADIDKGGVTRSVGFGADAGTTLTIAHNVLRSTILKGLFSELGNQDHDAIATGLRIYGGGTVKLDLAGLAMGQNAPVQNYTLRNLTMHDTSTLDVAFNGNLTVALDGGSFAADSSANIVHSGTGGNFTVLMSGKDNAALNSIESKVTAATTLSIDSGDEDYEGTVAVGTIKNANGNVEINVNTIAGKIETDGGEIDLSAIVAANNVIANGTNSNIYINSDVTVYESLISDTGELIIDDDASLKANTAAVEAETLIDVAGKLYAKSVNVVAGDLEIGTSSADAVAVAGDVKAGNVKVESNSSLLTSKIDATGAVSVDAGSTIDVVDIDSTTASGITAKSIQYDGGINLSTTGAAAVQIVTGAVKVGSFSGTTRFGDVSGVGIMADAVSSGVEIRFDKYQNAVLLTSALLGNETDGVEGNETDGVDIVVGELDVDGTVAQEDPDVTVTDVWTEPSEDSFVQIDKNGLRSNGTVHVGAIDLKEGVDFDIKAKKLFLDDFSIGESLVMNDVKSLTETSMSVGIIDEGTLVLHDNYTVEQAGFGEKVVVTTGDKVILGSVAGVNNGTPSVVVYEGAKVTLGSEATMNNVKLEEDIKVTDNVILNKVEIVAGKGISKAPDAGTNKVVVTETNKAVITDTNQVVVKTTNKGVVAATNGTTNDAIFTVNNDDRIESVVVSGNLVAVDTATQSRGLDIDNLVIKAEGIDFAEDGSTKVDILNMGDGITAPDPDKFTTNYYIESYVYAGLSDDVPGKLQITGTKDVAGIQKELVTNDMQQETIEALNQFGMKADSESSEKVLHDALGHVHRYSLTQRREILDAIAGVSTTALADSQRHGVQNVQKNLRNRVIQLGGASGEGDTIWETSGIQGWAQVDGSLSTVDGAYDYDTTGTTVGVNMDLTSNLVIGGSFSASFGEIKSEFADHASGNNDACYVSFFARHQYNRWVQMLILTYGSNEMDLERNVHGFKGKGDTNGSSFSAYYELGYTMALDYEYNHILQPLVSISLSSASVDGYKEEGSLGNAGLEYDGGDYFYGQVGLGLRYQGVLYETVHQRNVVLEARVMLTQDFGDATDESKVAFLGGGDARTVSGTDATGTGFEIGVGLSIPVEQQTTLYADVDYTSSPDYSGVRANVGLRYDF